MLLAFLIATVLIALAELGDKTQLLALVLATRYRVWQVLVGIFAATLLVHLLSTVLGALIGSLVPRTLMTWLAGLLFVGFGIWTFRGETAEQDRGGQAGRFGPVLTTAVAFFVAELGDKTQIMTMTIAADPAAAMRALGGAVSRFVPVSSTIANGPPVYFGVWMGSTLGMVLADGLAIAVGAVLGKALPERLVSRIAGALFILFGIGMIVSMYLTPNA